jgi:protein-tyrosine phosphatase
MWLAGPYRKYGRVDWTRVRRIVFVCQGNVCRSPFAHYCYSRLAGPLPVASLGLSTSTGRPADPTAIEVARRFDIDLSSHVAIDLADFEIADGDLLFVMEDRHIGALAPAIAGCDVQVALLGLWHRPRFALLYDPHSLIPDYFFSCFRRIELAVARLCIEASGHTDRDRR